MIVCFQNMFFVIWFKCILYLVCVTTCAFLVRIETLATLPFSFSSPQGRKGPKSSQCIFPDMKCTSKHPSDTRNPRFQSPSNILLQFFFVENFCLIKIFESVTGIPDSIVSLTSLFVSVWSFITALNFLSCRTADNLFMIQSLSIMSNKQYLQEPQFLVLLASLMLNNSENSFNYKYLFFK